MDQPEAPAGVQAKVAGVPAQRTDQASQILALASYWRLFHVAAGLLLIGRLLLGARTDRWMLLTVFAAAELGTVALTHDLGEPVTFPNSGNQLVQTIETQITRQLSSSPSSWLDPLWYGYLGPMIVGLAVAVAESVRKPA